MRQKVHWGWILFIGKHLSKKKIELENLSLKRKFVIKNLCRIDPSYQGWIDPNWKYAWKLPDWSKLSGLDQSELKNTRENCWIDPQNFWIDLNMGISIPWKAHMLDWSTKTLDQSEAYKMPYWSKNTLIFFWIDLKTFGLAFMKTSP